VALSVSIRSSTVEIRELSPFELLERLTFIGLVVYVGIILGIFFLKRGLAWLDDRFLITYTGHVRRMEPLETRSWNSSPSLNLRSSTSSR